MTTTCGLTILREIRMQVRPQRTEKSWRLISIGCGSSEGKGIVGHLFSNVVYQEQGNTIVIYYGHSSSKALFPHGYDVNQMKVKKDIPSLFNM